MVKGRENHAFQLWFDIAQSGDLTALRTKKIHMGVTICILAYIPPFVRSKTSFLCSK